MRINGLTSVALGLVVVAARSRNDLYIMPERFRVSVGETIVVALHNGDAFPESEASVSVERLRDTSLRSNSQTAPSRSSVWMAIAPSATSRSRFRAHCC